MFAVALGLLFFAGDCPSFSMLLPIMTGSLPVTGDLDRNLEKIVKFLKPS